MNFYLCLFTAPIFFASGNLFFKLWAIQNKVWLILTGMALCVVGNYFAANAIKLSSLFTAVSIIPLGTMTLSLLIGYFYFSEKIITTQYLGLFFAVISIMLLTFSPSVFAK